MDVYFFTIVFLVLVLAVSLFYNFSSTRRLTSGNYPMRKETDRREKKVQTKADAKKGETGKRKDASRAAQSDSGSTSNVFQTATYETGSEEYNQFGNEKADEDKAEEDNQNFRSDENEEMCNQNIQAESEHNIFRSFVNEDELTFLIRRMGIFNGLCGYVRENVEEWKERHVKIAVAGSSGTGKSSLINALRGLRPDEEGAAKVGITETTFEPVPFSFPYNDRTTIFDLPGMGTINFPKENYIANMEISTYDALIIVTSSRITENDVWFAKTILSANKHVLFVRTKLDLELSNEKKDNPKGFVEKNSLALMKTEINNVCKSGGLNSEELCGIYLVSSREKNKYDFPKLTEKLKDMLNISGRAIRTLLERHVHLFVNEKRELNKGEFLGRKVVAFISGLLPGTYNLSKSLSEIRDICLRKFCLDNHSLQEVSYEIRISVDDLKAKLKSFKEDEEETKASRFPVLKAMMRSVRNYHAVQYNLANMCDDMASDEMELICRKLDIVEEELSPL